MVPPFFNHSMSDDEIIHLHEICMTMGMHHVRVTDLHQGRLLVRTIVESLRYYHKIAFLGLHASDIQDVEDIYPKLFVQDAFDEPALYEYLLDLEADFIWIELTPALIQKQWLSLFKQGLHDCGTVNNTPILLMSYRKTDNDYYVNM